MELMLKNYRSKDKSKIDKIEDKDFITKKVVKVFVNDEEIKPLWVDINDKESIKILSSVKYNIEGDVMQFFPKLKNNPCVTVQFKYKPLPILTFDKLREKNVERCNSSYGSHTLDNWSVSDWVMATVGELGELANFLKKQKRGENIPKENIEKELADVAIYLDLLAAKLDVNLGEAVINKFNEVSDRIKSNIKL